MITNYPRGSEWRKWDLHIHTPGTAKNDQFNTDNLWEEYLDVLEEQNVPDEQKKNIAVLGITDYFSIENYKKTVNFQRAGRLQGKLLLPNIELRITPVTNQETPINLHIIFDNKLDTSIIEREFLGKLYFEYDGSSYNLLTENLVALGKAIRKDNNLNELAARKIGIEQINIPYSDIRKTLIQSITLKGRYLIAVSNSRNDGNSGIQESGLRATRCEIYKMADLIFSANPMDVLFFLGKKEGISAQSIIDDYGSLKPCVVGSDAHDLKHINIFPENRSTWIKADPTFEGLKQIIYEPEERVRIQEYFPEEKRGYEVINKIVLSGDNFVSQELLLNQNLVTIIGGRSSGKSTLLDGIMRKINTAYIKHEPIEDMEKTKEEFFTDICQEINIYWKDNNVAKERDIDYFWQERMYEIARDESKTNKLLEKILLEDCDFKKKKNEFSQFESENSSKINSKCIELFDLLKQKQEDKKPAGDRDGILSEITKITTEIDCIRKNGMSITDEEQKQFIYLEEKIKQKKNIKNQIIENINLIDKIIQEDVIAASFLSKLSLINSIECLPFNFTNDVDAKINSIRQEIKIFLNEKKQAFNSFMSQIEDDISQCENSALYAKGKNAFSENSRYNELQAKLKIEEGKLELFTQWENHQKKITDAITQCKESICSLHLQFSNKLLDEKTNIGNEIVITVSSVLQCNEITSFFAAKLNKQGNEKKSYVENFAEKYALNTKETLEEFIDKVCNNTLDCLTGNTPDDVLASFTTKNWFSNKYDITYQNDKFTQMSPGKKAYIILRLLLDYSKKTCPILIDQPEDSLDNRAIYSELVQYLKQKKKERQIILVTHNPNVVVGTDAEQVIVANQNGINSKNCDDKRFQYVSGALENTMQKKQTEIVLESQGIREHVCEILEGGEDAFAKREKKYGFSLRK